MSRIQTTAILVFSLLLTSKALPDNPEQPKSSLFAAPYGHVFFAMYAPNPDDPNKENRDGHGVCYDLTPEGLRSRWTTKGWCMSRGYLSSDGELLVRLGPWASDLEHQTDLAVAFYLRGRLLRDYRVCDLIKGKDSLELSASHYEWLAARATTPNGFDGDTFYLTLIDGSAIEFNARTGEITEKSRDYDAACEGQLWEEQERRWEQRGQEVLQSWPLYEDFKRHFTVDTAQVTTDSVYGVDVEFDGPYLDINFYPKHDGDEAGMSTVSINALVAIDDYDSGNAKLEFSNALLRKLIELTDALAETESVGPIEERSRKVVLRVARESLRWKDATKYPAEVQGEEWAELMYYENEHYVGNAYFNTRTKELKKIQP
jgi:hypothetical protein